MSSVKLQNLLRGLRVNKEMEEGVEMWGSPRPMRVYLGMQKGEGRPIRKLILHLVCVSDRQRDLEAAIPG